MVRRNVGTERWSEAVAQDRRSPAYRRAYESVERASLLGEAVRKARLARNMTQAELADAVGTSQSAIARLELGGGNPRIDTLVRVAAALGTELSIRFVKSKVG